MYNEVKDTKNLQSKKKSQVYYQQNQLQKDFWKKTLKFHFFTKLQTFFLTDYYQYFGITLNYNKLLKDVLRYIIRYLYLLTCNLSFLIVSSLLFCYSRLKFWWKYVKIEKVHLIFLKRILNVRFSASNMVYGKTGRFPFLSMLKKLRFGRNCYNSKDYFRVKGISDKCGYSFL